MAATKGTDSAGNINTIDKSGFITDLPEEGTEIQLGWLSYKPQFCAKLGGLQGVLIDSSQEQSDTAKNPDNPDGNFTAYIFQVTQPCPCVAGDVDKDTDPADVEYIRAEPGTQVMLVGTKQIDEELSRYLSDPDWYAELALVVTGKTKTKKGSMITFRFARIKSIRRSELKLGERAWNPNQLAAPKQAEELTA